MWDMRIKSYHFTRGHNRANRHLIVRPLFRTRLSSNYTREGRVRCAGDLLLITAPVELVADGFQQPGQRKSHP
jgi:hypothetical protein